ncbi:MAG: receptor ligand binding region family protein [Bacillales bacterium]|jgi:branched-chain amino acid transport system substrate-binding protein|nr:receptor ligand binding region family protein [Bacillales bacterium]
MFTIRGGSEMGIKKYFSVLGSTALLMSLMVGCGGNDEKETGSSKDSKVIKIATQSPLSGGSANLGESIKLGAQLKLEEQKKAFEDLGFELQLVPYDDQADPKKGVANAQLIGADADYLGLVGHLNSGVAIPSSEIYEKNNLLMVSPANTAVDVTERGLKTVTRIVARDDLQGPAGAQYAIEKLGAKKIFVIQDKTAYGTGLADAFKKAAEEKGAEVVGYEGVTIGEKDFNGVINQLLSKKPDFVFFGGMYTEFGLIVKQAREKGLEIPFMGGDGVDSSTLVEIAGDAVKNVYYTSVAGDTKATEEGKKFAENYKSKFGKEIESFSAYGYDAAGVLLESIKNAIEANGKKLPTREQVVSEAKKVQDYQGIVTKVGFDDKGDNTYAEVYIYKFNEAKYPGSLDGKVSK